MTIICDKQEKIPIFHEQCDESKALIYDESRGWSYDFHITTSSGQEITIERKSWADYRKSMLEDRVIRQASHTHALLIEFSDLDVDLDDPVDDMCMKRYQILSANTWVIHTFSPEHTMKTLRFLEKRGHTQIKDNGIKMRAANTRWMLMQSLTQVNPWRELTGGRLLGDELEKVIDWDAIAKGFNFEGWRKDVKWGQSRAIPKSYLDKASRSITEG